MKATIDSETLTKLDLAKIIGNNVHKYRIAARLTQEELAEKVGVGASFITRIKCGQKIMSVPVLYKLAKALHVSADMLLSERESISCDERLSNLISETPPETIAAAENLLRVCLSIIEH